MLSTLKKYLTYIIIATFPIMSLVDITPKLFMNLSLADVFVLLLGLVWIADIRRFKLKKHFPYAWYFLLYILLLLISNIYNMHSLANSAGVSGILSEILKIVTNSIFLFVAYNAISEDGAETKKIFSAWMIGLYLFILYGLYAQISQLSGVAPWVFNRTLGGYSRFLGTITDSNAAALYLSVSFFVVLVGKRYGVTAKGGWWMNATATLILVCIGLTMSRGGIAGFLCGLAVWIVFNIKTYLRYLCILPSVLCLLLLVLAVDTRFLSNNILSMFFVRTQDISSETGMLQTRFNLTLASVRMGLDHPVIGVGRGNFPLNSELYLREQDIHYNNKWRTYQNVVPHNTMAGVFAEMGLLGLVAFLSLFLLLFFKILKSEDFDLYFKSIILALWVSVFVQSLAISLENARVFWITTGLLLCFVDKKISFRKEQEEKNVVIGVRASICVTAASLILCGLLYTYVGVRYMDGNIDISETSLSIPYQATQAGRYIVRYYVNSPPDAEGVPEPTPMEVSVQKADTGEVLNSVRYDATVKGYANLFFDAVAGESFSVKFDGRNQSHINDVKIIAENNDKLVLAGNYPLLPKKIYTYCQRKGYLVSQTVDSNSQYNFFKTGRLDKSESILFDDKIRFKGVDITKTEDGNTQFDFAFDCLDTMEYDYSLCIRLIPDDINVLSDRQRSAGRIAYELHWEIPTSEWQPGMEYKRTHIANLKEANYSCWIAFWVLPASENPDKRLSTSSGGTSVTLGWFMVK